MAANISNVDTISVSDSVINDIEESIDEREFVQPFQPSIIPQELVNEQIFAENLMAPRAPAKPPVGRNLYETFNQQALDAHNEYRALHGAAPLTLNPELVNSAQQWAQYLASRNLYASSNATYKDTKLGENLSLWYRSNREYDGKRATDFWYKESKHYNFSKPVFRQRTSHFTELVWKENKEVGFGVVRTPLGYYVVAHYYPGAHARDQLTANVLAAKPSK